MFLTYFHYLPYLPGDETYDLEALSSASVQEYLDLEQGAIQAYPNPFATNLTLEFPCSFKPEDLVYIYDASGQLKTKITPETGATQIHLSAENAEWSALPKGVYFVSARINGTLLSKKLIKL
jgi:hypothetical protein